MYFTSLSIALALAASASSSPTPRALNDLAVPPEVSLPDALAKSTSGTVQTDEDGNVVSHHILSSDGRKLARRDDVPPACLFGGPAAVFSYRYWSDISTLVNDGSLDGKDGEVCFGWAPDSACNHDWGQAARNNIVHGLQAQITKDGQLETTDSGKWHAYFRDLTTAFADSDARLPLYAYVISSDANEDGFRQSWQYFYGRSSDASGGQVNIAATEHSVTCA